jgi:2-isopropylmalate synthase
MESRLVIINIRFYSSQLHVLKLLRYSVQSPGVSLNNDEKVAIATQLSKLGVDVLEAGFPIASIGDFEAVNRIAKEVGTLMEGRERIGKPMVCSL